MNRIEVAHDDPIFSSTGMVSNDSSTRIVSIPSGEQACADVPRGLRARTSRPGLDRLAFDSRSQGAVGGGWAAGVGGSRLNADSYSVLLDRRVLNAIAERTARWSAQAESLARRRILNVSMAPEEVSLGVHERARRSARGDVGIRRPSYGSGSRTAGPGDGCRLVAQCGSGAVRRLARTAAPSAASRAGEA